VFLSSLLRIYRFSEVKEVSMFGLGAGELMVIGVIVFLLFGTKRLPDIGKGLGGAIREFRKVKKDLSLSEDPKAPQASGSAQHEKPRALAEKPDEKAAGTGSKKSE
jgi:sec-independent protein translocase protein TatA